MQTKYQTFESRWGWCLVASTERGVSYILFGDSEAEVVAEMTDRSDNVVCEADKIQQLVFDFIEGRELSSKVRLDLQGTDFQLRVWQQLMKIGRGQLSTYGEIAQRLGDKKMARAVGRAVGSNPLAYLVPCHRVIRGDGGVGGYHWGLDRKRQMLEVEGVEF